MTAAIRPADHPTSERIDSMTAATFTPRRYSHALGVTIALRDLPHSEPGRPALVVAQDAVRAAVLHALGVDEVRTQAGVVHVGGIGRPGSYSAALVEVDFDAQSDADAENLLTLLLGGLEPLPVGGRVARWVTDGEAYSTPRRRQEVLTAVPSRLPLA